MTQKYTIDQIEKACLSVLDATKEDNPDWEKFIDALTEPEFIWPESLMLRDTKIIQEEDGTGPIYTTTGRGYEKHKYINSDIAVKKAEYDALELKYKALVSVMEAQRNSKKEAQDIPDKYRG